MEQLRGVVECITYQNAENGYSVIKCRAKGYQDLVKVVGFMPDVHVGSVLHLGGSCPASGGCRTESAAREGHLSSALLFF